MQIRFFDRYGFYSNLFKYILEKYFNPTIERRIVINTFKEEAELDIYTIKVNTKSKSVYIYGFDFSTGDWYLNGDWNNYILFQPLKYLCFLFSKRIGYG
jgi:hypothetical protein